MASSFAMALGPTRRRDSRAADRDGDESERCSVTTQMRAGRFVMLFRETDADLLGALANISLADRTQLLLLRIQEREAEPERLNGTGQRQG